MAGEYELIQGSGENILLNVTDANGTPVTPALLAQTGVVADFYLAGARKTYTKDNQGAEVPGGGMTYNTVLGRWVVTLTQADTYAMTPGFHTLYVKFRFIDEAAPISIQRNVKVIENKNKAVLS